MANSNGTDGDGDRHKRHHVPIRSHRLDLPDTPYWEGESTLDAPAIAQDVLDRFSDATTQGDWITFEGLWMEDAWWKDSLALTFDKRSIRGRERIVKAWSAVSGTRSPSSWSLDTKHTGVDMGPPTWSRLSPSMASLDVYFSFLLENPSTTCIGILKLLPVLPIDSGGSLGWKIWILNTVAVTFPAHPFRPLPRTSLGPISPSQRGKPSAQGLPKLEEGAVFDAIVVGLSSNGMANLIQLESIGLDVVGFDMQTSTGGFWSEGRYEAIQIHHPKRMIALPQYPVPPHFQKYLSGKDLSRYFSAAVRDLQLPVFAGIKVLSNSWDPGSTVWISQIEDVRTGETMTIRARNLVLSNGYLITRPDMPRLPSQEEFRGTVTHSYDVRGTSLFEDKDVLIVGAGNSGHDIAGQICRSGKARSISILQRSPMVLLEFSQLESTLFGLYEGELPVGTADVLQDALPNIVARPMAMNMLQAHLNQQAELNKQLEEKGYLLGGDPDIVGIVEERGRGFYMDQPKTLELVVQDKIKILRGEAKRFTADGVAIQHKDEEERLIHTDAVVFATGYKDVDWPYEWAESGFLDNESAGKVVNVGKWGFDREGEFPGFVTCSGRRFCIDGAHADPNLFFGAIALFTGRWVGKMIAMQVVANVTGLTPPPFSRD